MVRSKFFYFVLAIMASGCGRGFSVKAMEFTETESTSAEAIVEAMESIETESTSVKTMESTETESTNVDCMSECPNKAKKNDYVLYLFKDGKQDNYYLCEKCAIVKLQGKAYVSLAETSLSQFRSSMLAGDEKYECPNCKNSSYFCLRCNNKLSFCINCNTCFNNENKKNGENFKIAGYLFMKSPQK